MSFRELLETLRQTGALTEIDQSVSHHLQAAGILKQLEPDPVFFSQVAGSRFRVAGNLLCSKESFARYLGIAVADIIPTLTKAIEEHSKPEIVESAPCQEVIHETPDLDELPMLFYCEGDGGRYITSGVMIAGHPSYGQNMDFHRCMHAVLKNGNGGACGQDPQF